MRRVFLFLSVSLLTIMISGNAWSGADGQKRAIMHPDHDTLRKWITNYENAPKAPIDETIKSKLFALRAAGASSSISLLTYVPYLGPERDQGSCGNCWVWAGTGLMEIAHGVQNSVENRLSIQYLDSCKTDAFACNGGDLSDFTGWYNEQSRALPWSNANASYADGSVTSSQTSSSVACGSIGTSPDYYLDSFIPQTIDTTGSTTQDQAIANIKNVLNQNKAVWFAFWLANATDWNAFDTFWLNSAETVLWDPDSYCGHTYDEKNGGGHAIIIVGYDDSDANPDNHYWVVLNSWGTTSGRPTGLFRMKMNMNYGCILHETGYPDFYNNQFQAMGIDFNAAAPTVSATMPTNGATGVAVNTAIGATFSKVMDPSTVTATAFTLQNGASSVAGVVDYNMASKAATFTPSTDLLPNTTYTATITTGVADQSGTHMATSKSWSFTTGAKMVVDLSTDGFEGGFTGWATTQVSGTSGSWSAVSSGSYPVISPHGGAMMADFNSYDAASGDQTRLYRSAAIAIPSSANAAALSFWMYHDPGIFYANDEIQAQVSTDGSTWVNVGSPILRYNPQAGWVRSSVDLGAYLGQTVRIGFLGISDYGNDMYLDDVALQATETKPVLAVNVTGNGSVNSSPSGIACAIGNSGICSALFSTSPVTLNASGVNGTTYLSHFGSWSGGYDSASGASCTVAMSGDKNVGATFITNPPVYILGGSYYNSLQAAYNAGASGLTIESQAVGLPALDFTLDQGKTVILKGGFDSSYGTNGGRTTMDGILTVGTGSLTVENLIIQ